MFIRIIASVAYILILMSVVEGTCTCIEVCPNFAEKHQIGCKRSFSKSIKTCTDKYDDCCPNGICICNFWGCNCDGCGLCGCEKCTTQDCRNHCSGDAFRDLMEEKDACKDYKFFMSLSPEAKKEFLGDKYCDDGTAADNIFKKMLKYVDSNLAPNSINLDELHLSCYDFNRSVYYGEDADVTTIGRKLKLCKNNGSKKGRQKKNKNKNKNKKNSK